VISGRFAGGRPDEVVPTCFHGSVLTNAGRRTDARHFDAQFGLSLYEAAWTLQS
jgi:hypothetical protein